MLRRLKLYKDGTAAFDGFIRLMWAEHRAKVFLQDDRSALADAVDKAIAYAVDRHEGDGLALVAIFVMEDDADGGHVCGFSKFDGQISKAPLIYSLPVTWLDALHDRMQKRHAAELRMYKIDVKPCREEKIPMRPDGADPTTLS